MIHHALNDDSMMDVLVQAIIALHGEAIKTCIGRADTCTVQWRIQKIEKGAPKTYDFLVVLVQFRNDHTELQLLDCTVAIHRSCGLIRCNYIHCKCYSKRRFQIFS